MSCSANDGSPASLLWDQLNQSWTASLGMWSAWAETWQSLLTSRGVPAVRAMLEGFANPANWPAGWASLIEELEDIFALPRLADLPGLDGGTPLPSLAPAAELLAVAQEYMGALLPVWAQVCQRFQDEIAERRARGEPTDNAGRAMDLWNNVLDRTLMEFNRSADFAKLQQRFLHAAMRQRLEVRKLAERAAQAVDMPTRTELDEVYRRLHDLTREVHELRREIRVLRRPAPAKPSPVPRKGKGS